MKKFKLLFLGICVLFVFSCSNQFLPDTSEHAGDSIDEILNDPVLYIDSVEGAAVFVDGFGNRTVIESEEDGEIVSCSEVNDYFIFDDSSEFNRSISPSDDRCIAIVLGKRNDGKPGLWFVFQGGRIVCIENEDNNNTSELMSIVEGEQSLSTRLGWSYEATDMVVNGNEIIIVGNAENKEGITWGNYTFGANTRLGVYWVVSMKDESFYRLSRARVIGLREIKSSNSHGFFNRRSQWMWLFHLFFNNWYNKYLTESESVNFDEAGNHYFVYGSDNDGDRALATLIPGKVLSIEKDLLENHPPVATFPEGDLEVTTVGTSGANGVYIEAGTINNLPYYTQLNGIYRVFNKSFVGHAPPYPVGYYWSIGDDENESNLYSLEYIAYSSSMLPPAEGWMTIAGTSTVESVRTIPLSGGNKTGDTITVEYIFSDPDADLEGATEITWYRCQNQDSSIYDPNESVEIAGFNESNYVVQALDQYSFIKVEIVPVDEHGTPGTPLISEAFVQIGVD